MLESASLTSSSLKGLMIATTMFMLVCSASREVPWTPDTRPLLPFPWIPALTQAPIDRCSSGLRLFSDLKPLLLTGDQAANILMMPQQHQRRKQRERCEDNPYAERSGNSLAAAESEEHRGDRSQERAKADPGEDSRRESHHAGDGDR